LVYPSSSVRSDPDPITTTKTIIPAENKTESSVKKTTKVQAWHNEKNGVLI
jgi:hypothetical protein